jgi:hypothetical protein
LASKRAEHGLSGSKRTVPRNGDDVESRKRRRVESSRRRERSPSSSSSSSSSSTSSESGRGGKPGNVDGESAHHHHRSTSQIHRRSSEDEAAEWTRTLQTRQLFDSTPLSASNQGTLPGNPSIDTSFSRWKGFITSRSVVESNIIKYRACESPPSSVRPHRGADMVTSRQTSSRTVSTSPTMKSCRSWKWHIQHLIVGKSE